MAEQDKEKKSILGLGLPNNLDDPNAWRPSKPAHRLESDPSLKRVAAEKQESTAGKGSEPENRDLCASRNSVSASTESSTPQPVTSAWRPSRVNQERLSFLSATRRKRFAMSPRTRLIFTAALFACGSYFCVKVWLMPQAGELHLALVIAVVAMALLFVSAIVGAARRRRVRNSGDDQSTLRL